VLGYPKAALADAAQTVSDAREIGQAVALSTRWPTRRSPPRTAGIRNPSQ